MRLKFRFNGSNVYYLTKNFLINTRTDLPRSMFLVMFTAIMETILLPFYVLGNITMSLE